MGDCCNEKRCLVWSIEQILARERIKRGAVMKSGCCHVVFPHHPLWRTGLR
jgi:hypothetical protein